MLNNDALAELSKLKKIIEDSKDRGEGIIAGSHSRHGFVKLDDGRSVYIDADGMQRVLPGDRVKVEIITNNKNKAEAKLEKLLQKNFIHFVGTYTIKGNNHFVIPDHKETQRGLFVPPKERKKFAHGDIVQCQLVKHPFTDGKSLVKIHQVLAKPDDPGVEQTIVEHKYRFTNTFTPAVEQQLKTIGEQLENLNDQRENLQDVPFVTIDAETTLDLDDALYAEKDAEKDTEKDSQGWWLYSAIADPSPFITAGSPIDKEARNRASSIYFPGRVIPMLPMALANEYFSLKPNTGRPALICKMHIAKDGAIDDYQFFPASIQSQAKLNYQAVADYFDQGAEPAISPQVLESLHNLRDIAAARRHYRQQHCLLQDDSVDYQFELNEKLHISAVNIGSVTSAHRVVEEAMLATNFCAGTTLAQHQASTALFACHNGFRPQRIHEAQHLLKQTDPALDTGNIDSFTGFIELFRALEQKPELQQVKIILRRLLQGAEVSHQPLPHFGLGFEYYALITSPIRRYQDLHNHRLLRQIISSEKNAAGHCNPEKLQEKIAQVRLAQRELDQRLLCHFLADKTGQTFMAKVMAVSSQGLALRLMDNGGESFVQLRNNPKQQVKYDSVQLSLTVNDTLYQLEQELEVKLEKVNLNRYQLHLSLS